MATPAEMLATFPKLFKPDEAEGVDVVFQYSLSGDNGGDWYVTIKDKTCKVTEGVHENPTTTIEMTDENFVKLISGELKPATAMQTRKIKFKGNMMKAQIMEKIFEQPK